MSSGWHLNPLTDHRSGEGLLKRDSDDPVGTKSKIHLTTNAIRAAESTYTYRYALRLNPGIPWTRQDFLLLKGQRRRSRI